MVILHIWMDIKQINTAEMCFLRISYLDLVMTTVLRRATVKWEHEGGKAASLCIVCFINKVDLREKQARGRQ